MLEKDLYDKYNFKVLISRPQSVFTKAFVVVDRENEKKVLNSKYSKFFKFIHKGRYMEKQPDGQIISDVGDIYLVDLKGVWETYYKKLSFPQFKYWYFNSNSHARDKVDIMPEINEYYFARQKLNIEARGDLKLNELRESLLREIEYISNTLYESFKKSYFTKEEFARKIKDRYGMAKARVIANSIFELTDPEGKCVKFKRSGATGQLTYSLAFGNFKEYMRRPVLKSKLIKKISVVDDSKYSSYESLKNNDNTNIALKLLSIFDFITYEVTGGEEPEIFIRLNDPNKIRDIVFKYISYSNSYVVKAGQKHQRDYDVLLRFFTELSDDNERWDYIENYFLGEDVLLNSEEGVINAVPMKGEIDQTHSFSTEEYDSWDDLETFFDDDDLVIIKKLAAEKVDIPEYLETTLIGTEKGQNIMMCWPSKNVAICNQDIIDSTIEEFRSRGWYVCRALDIDYDELVEKLK